MQKRTHFAQNKRPTSAVTGLADLHQRRHSGRIAVRHTPNVQGQDRGLASLANLVSDLANKSLALPEVNFSAYGQLHAVVGGTVNDDRHRRPWF